MLKAFIAFSQAEQPMMYVGLCEEYEVLEVATDEAIDFIKSRILSGDMTGQWQAMYVPAVKKCVRSVFLDFPSGHTMIEMTPHKNMQEE